MVLVQVARADTASLVLAYKSKTAASEVVVVGHFAEPGAKANWKSLATAPYFVELFTRYMKGGLSVRPGILEGAKVAAGEYIYAQRTHMVTRPSATSSAGTDRQRGPPTPGLVQIQPLYEAVRATG